MITDPELKGLGAQALNLVKRDLEQGTFNFLLAAYHIGERLYRLKKVEALIIERLGEDWLNSGSKKDIGFHILRMAVQVAPPDAAVFATVANAFTPTERFLALPVSQRHELLDAGYDRHHRAVAEGFLTVGDALCAIVQTPERVCQYTQDLQGGQPKGKPRSLILPQANFSGRLKMFGTEDAISRG